MGILGEFRDAPGTLRGRPGTHLGRPGELQGCSRDAPGTAREAPGASKGRPESAQDASVRSTFALTLEKRSRRLDLSIFCRFGEFQRLRLQAFRHAKNCGFVDIGGRSADLRSDDERVRKNGSDSRKKQSREAPGCPVGAEKRRPTGQVEPKTQRTSEVLRFFFFK